MSVKWALEALLLASVATYAVEAQGATCANTRCQSGYKCVLVEPQNCVGCPNAPRCVQQECNTNCVLPCPFRYSCVLVATSW
ncbi:unnamed protein product [Cylicocyclus nassatus]|uniref:Uncharacterized protein n=1 Tax=Cylicocyclus nassatus TaxID=53992 RepID=A0AA36DPZ8_CYLNA|nr:unnamed protein product [Cylicocyclus nassatus]